MKIRLRLVLGLCTVGVLSLSLIGSASADAFNQNHIMDDAIFDNANSLTASQINAWLNSNFGSTSCISTDHGFSAPAPIGYNPTNGFLYGSNVTAGEVIYDAAQAYGINPQVLLATLQKEQTLVSGAAGCSTLRYTGAMGYGCPDGGTTYNYSGVNLYSINNVAVTSVNGTCVNSAAKAGFSQQIIHAAWLLKFGEQRSEGNINWAVIKGSWDNSDDPQSCYGGPMTQGTWQRCPSGGSAYYDGYTTIDGTAVHMDTGPTATLYWYTPHFNGNDNFFNIFLNWFGTPYTSSYYWEYISQGAYTDSTKSTALNDTHLLPGQRFYVELKARNVGAYTWYQQGTAPMRLGTDNPQDRLSPFCDSTWISCSRPTVMQETSVAPGQTATFDFWMQTPNTAGTYNEYFNLVADGYTWLNNNGLYFSFNVDPQYKWSYVSSGAYYDAAKTLPANANNIGYGQRLYLTLAAKNTGNTTWENSGSNPMHLGTAIPNDRSSAFCDTSWINCARPADMIESSVAPGQTGTFEFWVTAPSTSGTYNEYFNLVAENNTWLNADNGLYYTLKVNPPSYTWSYVSQAAYTDSSKSTLLSGSLSKGQRAYLVLSAKNTGNTTWYPGGPSPIRLGTSNPYDRTSRFCDSSWISCQRVTSLQQSSVAPGQTGTFEFWVTAPSTSGTYNEYFNIVAENTTWLNNLGLYYTLSVN